MPIEVGASRAVSTLFFGLGLDSRRPARFVSRVWGFILVIGVAYVEFVVGGIAPWQSPMMAWISAYVVYLVGLEAARKQLTAVYDTVLFRLARTWANLTFLTLALALATHDRPLIALLYSIPLFAAALYFQSWWFIGTTWVLAMIGLFLGGVWFPASQALGWTQFSFTAVLLSIMTLVLKRVCDRAPNTSSPLTEAAAILGGSLDLEAVLRNALSLAKGFTSAHHCLIVIVDPESHRYLADESEGLVLREGASINDVVRRCTVLQTRQPFVSRDTAKDLPRGSIYEQTYECRPRSIMGFPLLYRDRLLGVITVARSEPDGFDRLSERMMRQLAEHVAAAVDAALRHRRLQLVEARSQQVGPRFASAATEVEVVKVLTSEVAAQLNSDHIVVQLAIEPSVTISGPPGSCSLPMQFDGVVRELSKLSMDVGEPLRVGSLTSHPELSISRTIPGPMSAIAAPLISEQSVFGAVTILRSGRDSLTLDDEVRLSALAHHAAVCLKHLEDFQRWKLHGSTLRQILDEVRGFDPALGDPELCLAIAKAAQRTLGFDIVRVRLFDTATGSLVTHAIEGVTDEERARLIGQEAPSDAFRPLLIEQYRAGQSFLIPPDAPEWRDVEPRHFHPPNLTRTGAWTVDHALITPLECGSATLGLMSLDAPVSGSVPTTQSIDAIGVFGNAAGWALERAQSFRRLREQQRQTDALLDSASREMAVCRDVKGLASVATRVGRELLGAQCCCLCLVRGGADTLIDCAPEPFDILPNSRTLPSGCPGGCDQPQEVPILSANGARVGGLFFKRDSGVVQTRTSEHLQKLVDRIAPAVEIIDRYEAVQKWERAGIFDDLHEMVNWLHMGVSLQIEAADIWMQREAFERAQTLIGTALTNSRAAVTELRALHSSISGDYVGIDDFSIVLNHLVKNWRQRFRSLSVEPTQIKLDCSPGLVLPVPFRTPFMRVASHAVQNAIQHSGALIDPGIEITVSVRHVPPVFELRVTDNGRGSDHFEEGTGVRRMKHFEEQLRNQNYSVSLDINSSRDGGTIVTLKVDENERLSADSSNS